MHLSDIVCCFPNRTIPEIVTIISGFTYKIAATEKTLAIGLDMYLGANYPYYASVQFPAYRKTTFERKKHSERCTDGLGNN